MHECIRCPETPSGTLEERKLGVSRVYIAHDHLGRAERRLESAILICALLQLFSWVSGRLNALLHACQSLVKKWVTRAGPPATGRFEATNPPSTLQKDPRSAVCTTRIPPSRDMLSRYNADMHLIRRRCPLLGASGTVQGTF